MVQSQSTAPEWLESIGAIITAVVAVVGIGFAAVRRMLAAHEQLDETRFEALAESIHSGFKNQEKLFRALLDSKKND